MKQTFLYLAFLVVTASKAQNTYWQQQVNFTISVSLNDKDNSLSAFETIEYINHSPDTLHFIWFHLWPNAYKNDRTAFSEQRLQAGNTDFYFSKAEDRGYINQLSFKADDINAEIVADSNHIDIIKVLLPRPLPPGGKTNITTPFRVKLPFNFSRGGHVGHDYQATQWFPKPAVYDREGWHPMPYLDQGEFFSEFGNFDVQITVPAAYVVAATGVLQDTAMLQQLKEKGKHAVEGKTKTWHYRQDNVHDFAWFTSKEFKVKYDTVMLQSKVVDVFSYYKAGSKAWAASVGYVKEAVKKYSGWLGEYPYTTVSVVQGSSNKNSGGMEYPTITLITIQDDEELEVTILHEVGHNWLYGALASDERTHPWMDEGMNTFYQKRFQKEKYQSAAHLKDNAFKNKLPDDEGAVLFAMQAKTYRDQPIETISEAFTPINYALSAYYKASRWMEKLQEELGTALFDSCIHNYYRDYSFRHVYPEDFKLSLEKSSGKNLDRLFNKLHTTGSIEPVVKKTIKPSFILHLKNTDKYNYINIAPAVAYNHYDGFMPGVLVHNYQLPENNFRFVAAALYGTGSKEWNYIGNASYTYYPHSAIHFIVPAITFSKFNTDNGIGELYQKIFRGFFKIAPSLKIEFEKPRPASTVTKWVELKSYFIKEEAFDFKQRQAPQDTLDYYAVKGSSISTAIYQAAFGIENDRVLYPYKAVAQLQKAGDLLRATITANYYYNYSPHQGISLRFFGGKIFYTRTKTQKLSFANDRYHFNMYGANGYDDYTYSNPFIDRNQSTAFSGRQIMIRDGGFKYRSDFSSERPGRSDNWLMALNVSADIPTNINPLSVLPFKVPLKVFADAGTSAEAWKENSPDPRFLYSIGLQLPVLKYINFYCVILQSSQFKSPNENNGDKWWQKRITFSIDVQNIARKVKGLELW